MDYTNFDWSVHKMADFLYSVKYRVSQIDIGIMLFGLLILACVFVFLFAIGRIIYRALYIHFNTVETFTRDEVWKVTKKEEDNYTTSIMVGKIPIFQSHSDYNVYFSNGDSIEDEDFYDDVRKGDIVKLTYEYNVLKNGEKVKDLISWKRIKD